MAIQEKIFDEAISEAKANLLEMAKKLDKFRFPKCSTQRFRTNNLDVDDVVRNIPVGSDSDDFIYIFKVVGKNRKNKQFVVFLDAERKKQADNDDKKDLPRINESNRGSQYLYVGRSQKLRSRLRQHLGVNYNGTYAMHMKRWCTSLNEEIEIQYFVIENKDNLLVQSVEDSLWEKLQPCFGKRGAK